MMNIWPLMINEEFNYPEDFVEDYSCYLSPTQMEQSNIFCFIVNKDKWSRIFVGVKLDDVQLAKIFFEVHDVVLEHEKVINIFSEMLLFCSKINP